MLERVHAPNRIEVSDFALLKSATRAAVRSAGPIAVLANETRLDGGTISRAGNLRETNYIPIDDAVRIDAMTGDCRIVRAMARLLGYRLVPINAQDNSQPSLVHDAGIMAREAGELVSDTIEVSADGNITPNEARIVDDGAAAVEHCAQSIRKRVHRVMVAR